MMSAPPSPTRRLLEHSQSPETTADSTDRFQLYLISCFMTVTKIDIRSIFNRAVPWWKYQKQALNSSSVSGACGESGAEGVGLTQTITPDFPGIKDV